MHTGWDVDAAPAADSSRALAASMTRAPTELARAPPDRVLTRLSSHQQEAGQAGCQLSHWCYQRRLLCGNGCCSMNRQEVFQRATICSSLSGCMPLLLEVLVKLLAWIAEQLGRVIEGRFASIDAVSATHAVRTVSPVAQLVMLGKLGCESCSSSGLYKCWKSGPLSRVVELCAWVGPRTSPLHGG